MLMLVLSKIVSRALGWRYWRELLPFSAYALYGLVWGFTPILWALGFLTRRIARDETANVVTRSEIESIAEMSNTSGTLDASEHQILKNLLSLDEVQVSTVMTPRTVMLCFQEDITIGEVLQATEQLPYSRLPIYAQNRDDITGFVLRHEILAGAARDEHQRVLRELRREIISVPEAMSLARFIQELVEKHHHIALVVDEYGGTAGIITMEDAIESLLGVEITDETDLVADLRLLASQRYDRQRTLLGFVMGETSNPPIDE
jgi:CBS domain containing-hemolysin-like protein